MFFWHARSRRSIVGLFERTGVKVLELREGLQSYPAGNELELLEIWTHYMPRIGN